jgi:hypothetical protein
MVFRRARIKPRTFRGLQGPRKAIPKEAQVDFARRYEAKLTLPASLSDAEGKARHGEWLSEIKTRIAIIRARKRGERQPLRQRQAQALAGGVVSRIYIAP